MVKYYLHNNKVGVTLGGYNFEDLKEILKDYDFQYKSVWNSHNHIWCGSGKSAIRALYDLQRFEFFEIQRKDIKLLLPEVETKYHKISYKTDLLKAPPIGQFQENGIKLLLKQTRYMLAWEMGLGKTFAVISALNHLHAENLVDSVLIVAPSESIYNFQRELIQFSTFVNSEDDVYVANVNNRQPFESDKRVIIMTYRTFLMLSDDAYKRIHGRKSTKYRSTVLLIDQWGSKRAIILDESHKVKNVQSRQSKVLHLHKHFFDFRYLLTGTPDPNGVNGFYSQINFMDNSIIGENYITWLKSVANLGTKWSEYGINFFYSEPVKKFVNQIKPWVDRQYTENNIDLPDLKIKKIYVGMNNKQKYLYQELVSHWLKEIQKSESSLSPRYIERTFPLIMQSLEDPCLLKGKTNNNLSKKLYDMIEKWKFTDHSQLESCSSLLNTYIEEGDHKVILWGGHPLTMNSLKEYYKKYNPITIHGRIDVPFGKTAHEYKNELLEKFKADKKHQLLIASYFVLSTAVNIIEAPRAIYWDRSFNPAAWMQSIKRNHRIGQTEKVFINPLIIEHSLDERLDRQLDKKDKLNNNLMNADSLSVQEWKDLFQGSKVYE